MPAVSSAASSAVASRLPIAYRGTAVGPRTLVVGAMVLWAAGFSALAVLRYNAFLNKRFDLGNLTQAVWTTAHGEPLSVTEVGGEQIVRLGAHVDPILVLFAPLWWLWPSPLMLGVVQAVAVALGALPVFWLARKHLPSERGAAYLALAYLLYAPVQWNTMNEFDPPTLAIPLVLFAVWYLDEDRLWAFAAFALLAASTREQMPLLLAGLGLWYAVSRRRLVVGAAIAAAGVALTVLAFEVVIPAFSGGSSPFESRYAAVGGSPLGIAQTLVTDPALIVREATTANDLVFLAMMFVPLLGFFALSPALMAGMLPQLGLILLSARATDASVGSQVASPIVPFAIAAAVLGVAKLREHAATAASLVLVATSVSLVFGPLPTLGRYGGLGGPDLRARAAGQALELVPDGAPVSATNRAASHLSGRRYLYSFPVIRRAEWIVVDDSDGWLPNVRHGDKRDGLAVGVTDLSPQPDRLRREIAALRADPRWRIVFEEAGVLVFRRREAPA